MRLLFLSCASLVVSTVAGGQSVGGARDATPESRFAPLPYQARFGPRTKGSGPVTVYELIDFQCPYCRTFADQTYPQVESQYLRTGRVRWVVLYVPRPQHKNAMRAGEIGLCAGQAGKFWQVNDRILRAQPTWAAAANPDEVLYRIVDSVGVDRAAVASCVARGDGRREIQDDAAFLASAGLANQGVPTFIVAGRIVAQGAEKFPRMSAILDSVLIARGY